MDFDISDSNIISNASKKRCKNKLNLRNLRISLKYRPEILKLIMKMRQCIKKKNFSLKKIKQQLKFLENKKTVDIYLSQENQNSGTNKTEDTLECREENTIFVKINSFTQTEDVCANKRTKSLTATKTKQIDISSSKTSVQVSSKDSSTQTKSLTNDVTNEKNLVISNSPVKTATTKKTDEDKEAPAWNINKDNEEGKSIADQVKEAAQSALQQSGMVYVESAGMYYDYKTGYYYNSELGLYYHTNTECYYSYSDDKQEFVFHSYPDRSASAANASLAAHEKRKAKKHKKDNAEEQASKPKRKKNSDKKKNTKEKVDSESEGRNKSSIKPKSGIGDTVATEAREQVLSEDKESIIEKQELDEIENGSIKEDLEDGECSETESEKSQEDDGEDESDASTSTASDDDAVAKHHPPCMRVIVRETALPKLRVGSLFLVTKDGGTIGREGDQHTILIKDHNVSRNHLDIRYDMSRRMYLATDLGSKNGTLLNGIQMSESQVPSQPMEVVHGSTIQLGETKLLCHVHPGNNTCGHCEPGLLMETQEKEKAAYTRTCSVQKQYHLELARLKNKYAPEPLMIEDGSYQDRAKARRDTVGSSHHSEKTQTSHVDAFIAPENKGFKLLEKMGWSKGEGLGRDNQGDVEPIPMVNNESKAGLGTPGAVAPPAAVPAPKIRNTLGPATLRLAQRTKMLQPPAKAFQNPLEEDSE